MLPYSLIPVQTTTSDRIRYVTESIGVVGETGKLRFGETEVPVTERKWNVTDSAERAKAAHAELGPLPDHVPDEWWSKHAAWFIDAKRNAAALVVFRPPTKEAVAAWAEATSPA